MRFFEIKRQIGRLRACAFVRQNHHQSEWTNGPERACRMCQKRGRLCVVICGELMRVMPRVDDGEELREEDEGFWVEV